MAYDIGSILTDWEMLGVFDFLLPMLLIFAFVFGILTSSNFISKQKGINIIIALVVSILSLRFGFIEFFGLIFPRLGVGLAVLLVLIILVAAFIPKEHMGGWLIAFYATGAIIAVVVIYTTFSELNWFGNMGFWNDNVGLVLAVLSVIGVIIAISTAGGDSKGGSSSGASVTLPIAPVR